MEHNLYTYRARVERVIDGDTIKVAIDLGLNTWIHGENLRLARINAPEMRGDERVSGLASKKFVENLLDGQEIYIMTVKDRKGKYGRYLAEVWLEMAGTYSNVNDWIAKNGYARYRVY